jgi:hypothetical protein
MYTRTRIFTETTKEQTKFPGIKSRELFIPAGEDQIIRFKKNKLIFKQIHLYLLG